MKAFCETKIRIANKSFQCDLCEYDVRNGDKFCSQSGRYNDKWYIVNLCIPCHEFIDTVRNSFENDEASRNYILKTPEIMEVVNSVAYQGRKDVETL